MFRKLAIGIFALVIFNLLFFPFGKSSNFFFPAFGSVGFLALIIGTQIYLYLVFYPKRLEEKHALAFKASLGAILLSFTSLFRASSVDINLLSLTSIFLTTVSTYLLALDHNIFGSLSEILFIPLKVLSEWGSKCKRLWLRLPFFIKRFTADLFDESLPGVNRKRITPFVLGFILAVPVIAILVFLLSSADPIFAKIIRDVFRFKFPAISVWVARRIVYSVIFLLFVVPVALMKIGDVFRSPFSKKERFEGLAIPWTIVTGAVLFVLGFFIIVQFRYLFATVSETQLHRFGVNTYSEYVRKGFFELTLVSIIVYAVSGIAMTVNKGSIKKGLLKNINIFLLLELLFFISSIFRRVFLYQATHGLTRVRVYGSAFLLLLFILTVFLILRQTEKRFKKWYLYETASVIAVIFATSVLGVDSLVATAFPPTVNNQVDYVYISRLSADAVDGWLEGYEHARKEVLLLSSLGRELTSNELRRAVYADLTLSNFYYNYRYLVAKYSGEEDDLTRSLNITVKSIDGKKVNIREKIVFGKLKRADLDIKELSALINKSKVLVGSVPSEVRYRNLDRSINSPLVPELTK